MFKKFLFLFLLITSFVVVGKAWADEDDDIDDLTKQIQEYQEKLDSLSQQSKTLANEIASFDAQISLTELRIQSSIAEIEKRTKLLVQLEEDIADLQGRIERLSDSIDYQKNVLGERIRARYKSGVDSPFYVIFGSETLGSLVKKTEYLKVLQMQDQELLDEMEKTKSAFTQQKDLFEEKKQETEELKANVEAEKANLESYRQQLDGQKQAKQALLQKTQNDETKFQRLLADAQRELSQIVGAAVALRGSTPVEVDKGEVIGIQGNTGYSFGDHLHFGVYRYGSIDDISGWNWYYSNTVDPAKKLKSKSVTWDEGCGRDGTKSTGSGSWNWPMNSFVITQGYGHTCYSDTYYGGNPHPAYDMAGPKNTPVYAADDGKAYFCRNCLGDGANGVFIFHDDDYMTVYWHLQ